MSRLLSTIGLLPLGLILSGCISPPPMATQNNSHTATQTPQNSAAATASASKTGSQTPPSAANPQANAQAMQEIMEELRQLGTLDPAAQNKLMEDLRQTDPALWPLVMQQFRAAIAYKRRSDQRENMAAAANGQTAPNLLPGEIQSAASLAGGVVAPDAPNPPACITKTPPRDYYAAASELRSASSAVKSAAGERPAKDAAANKVSPASYNAPAADAHDISPDDLSGAIKALEATASSDPKTADDLARQARLRMLYVLAGRRDDALKPIPSAPPAMQDFWTKELYGLSTLLDSEKNPDPTRRAAESKQAFAEALSRLGETAPLAVRNLSFCTAIQSYGCFTPFHKYEFTPDQEALLYAEMDNFASESTAKGYHTQLRSSYQILDSAGQRVADHTFTNTEEYCQNARRDFFIGYHLRMPKRINPGKYTLQMTIEDLQSQKVGQSSVEFTVKDAEK